MARVQSASHLDILRAQARALPEAPGVYFWKDGRQRTLYIGKAVNLRARVTSYFSHARRDARTRELLSRARNIQHELASTELEALFRESALIKKEQPPFNRALRTSRTLYYFKLDSTLLNPYLEITRETLDDGSLYFGPFQSAAIAREVLGYLHDVLPLRKCTAAKPRCRPCLYYQMHKCAAPALDDEHRQRHQEAIAHLSDLLDGRSDRVIAWLEGKRDKLSDLLLFERAAEVQQRLDALHELLRRQTILEAAMHCRCVVVKSWDADESDARLLLVAHGSVLSVRAVAMGTLEEIVRWVQVHGPLVRVARHQQPELDAATVLERWLVRRREQVRWVAIPHDADQSEIRDRLAYVLDRRP